MPKKKQAEVNLILGKRGSGKSTLGKMLLDRCQRYIIYDTLYEYGDSGITVETVGEFVDFMDSMKDKSFRVVYQPCQLSDFELINRLVLACGNLTYMVEEIDVYLKSNPASIPPYFTNIIQRGRHYGIEFIGITQRPYLIPPLLRAQVRRLYSFLQTEKVDVEFCKYMMGEDGEKVKTLQPYQYMCWDEKGNINTETTTKI